MVIYHFSAKVISRTDGRSSVAAAAYRAAEVLHDARRDLRHDYMAKAGVVHSEIMLPVGAPDRLSDRATLWNEVEAGEKRKDAQLARDLEIALPRELPRVEAVRLVQDFVREQFVARGMIADLNVHWGQTAEGEEQPHAHVMLTMRAVGPNAFGPKVRDWNRTELLSGWRVRWAELANERLAEQGYELRIDHRSYRAQGIALEPQNKIGPAGARREDRGQQAERAAEHREIARRNGERLLVEPGIALEALTQQQSTFTRHHLARFVNRHTDGAAQFGAVMAVVEASPELVRVGKDGRGGERLSTREMVEIEQRMVAGSVLLGRRTTHRVDEARRRIAVAASTLSEEQQLAFLHLTRSRGLAAVVGVAGGGKSTMLGAARKAWEGQGYRVRGAALSGIAAEGLECSAGIGSRTIASWEHGWAKGREQLTREDVLVVDEAGMLGSRQLGRLVARVQDAGAKLVLIGDAEQLQAIEAGAAFRAITERVGAVMITEPRRQKVDWQREATKELATARTGLALDRYEAAGMVHGHATLEAASTELVAGWDAARQAHPGHSQLMLAHRRADVRALNEAARGLRKAAGELGPDRNLATELGSRAFAEGDRLYFLRNERGLGVKNGTLGTIERIAGTQLTVRLDSAEGAGTGRLVTFGLADYAHIDHGYAATVHKSQGVTVDQAHVLATPGMDRHLAYVALSRHRHGVQLHWSGDEFRDGARLRAALGREGVKDTSLDYEGDEPAPVAAYALRRGLEPLGPASEIVVQLPPGGRLESLAERYEDTVDLSVLEGIEPAVARPRAPVTVSPATGSALEAPGADLPPEIVAGVAAFMEGYEAHQRREQDEQVQALVDHWGQLIQGYGAVLPRLDRDPMLLAGAREQLLQFGRSLRDQPELVRVLLERGAVFGMDERPNLKRVLAAPAPERAIGAILDASETAMRAQLREQVEREAARQQEIEAQQRPSPSRGPSMR